MRAIGPKKTKPWQRPQSWRTGSDTPRFPARHEQCSRDSPRCRGLRNATKEAKAQQLEGAMNTQGQAPKVGGALRLNVCASRRDRKSTRLKLQSQSNLVCRLLLEKKKI